MGEGPREGKGEEGREGDRRGEEKGTGGDWGGVGKGREGEGLSPRTKILATALIATQVATQLDVELS